MHELRRTRKKLYLIRIPLSAHIALLINSTLNAYLHMLVVYFINNMKSLINISYKYFGVKEFYLNIDS
jgi:hypothetical protein